MTDLASAGGRGEGGMLPVVSPHSHQPRDYLLVQLQRERGRQHRARGKRPSRTLESPYYACARLLQEGKSRDNGEESCLSAPPLSQLQNMGAGLSCGRKKIYWPHGNSRDARSAGQMNFRWASQALLPAS